MSAGPSPKPRNASRTKDQILESAKAIFFRLGYSNTSIREIAVAADIDPVLVRRYFGSKANLFKAALIEELDAQVKWDTARPSKAGYGRRLADRMLSGQTRAHFALVTLTTEDADARKIGDQILREHILPPLAAWLGPPDALTRAVNFFILTNGFALYIHQTRFDETTPDIERGTVDWFARSVQAIVDQTEE